MKLSSALIVAFLVAVIATVVVVLGANHPNTGDALKALEAIDVALAGAIAGAHVQSS